MLNDGEYIEIQGDMAQIVERRVIRQVRLQDALTRLETNAPVTLPTIARTQVFAHFDGSSREEKKLYILSEIPASIKSISKNMPDRTTARRYRLAMPWTYLWFMCSTDSTDLNGAWSIADYRIFHARQRYAGINSEMIVARLPNVYGDGRICWGATGVSPNMSLADRIDQLTNEWYLSRFNSDLDTSVPLPYNEPNYRRWVAETIENPNCWQNWPEWIDTNVTKFTVRSLLSEAQQTPRTEEILLPGAIPEIPIRLTFGRWEEWWLQLPPEERARASISMANLGLDDPNNIPALAPELPVEDGNDDGGVEIPFVR